MNIFQRLFSIFKAETNSAIEKFEEPIKLTEQGIRDLKVDLSKSIESLASIKAMAIRSRKEADGYKDKSKSYEKKAMALLKKAQGGDIDASEAERLAKEALSKKQQNDESFKRADAERKRLEKATDDMQTKVQKLRSNISTWETELRTLKSRVKVTEATKKVNKQLADVDPSSTLAMLERMKEKVDEQEALAESYEQIANENTSVDAEIDNLLDVADVEVEDELEAMKRKLGMGDAASDDSGDK